MLAYSPAHTNGILVHPQSLAQQSACTAAHMHGLHPGHPSHTLQPAPDNTPRTTPERPCLTSYSPPAVSAIASSKRPAPVLVDSSTASALSHTIHLAPRYANCITCFPTASMPPPATCSRLAAALSLHDALPISEAIELSTRTGAGRLELAMAETAGGE